MDKEGLQPEPPLRMVEWYRPDQSRRVLRIWALGASLVAGGALCAIVALRGLGSLGELGPALRGVLALVGGAAVLGGPLWSILRLVRAMRDDDYLALQSNAIVVARKGEVEVLPWDDVVDIEHRREPTELLCLRLRGGAELCLGQRYAGIDLGALARRISHLRSKVLMNLLAGPPASRP